MQLGIHFTSTTKPPFFTTMTSSYSNIYPSQTCTCMTTTAMFPSQIYTTYYTNLASTGEPDCITPVAISVSVVFILTATLSSVLTLILTLLCIKMRSHRPKPATKPDSGPTHPAEQVEQHQQSKVAVYDEIVTRDHSVPLTNNPAYGTH